MSRTVDQLLGIILFIGLATILLVEIANLSGFGSQEAFLQHPGYPSGTDYESDLKKGLLQLQFWTILTATLFFSTIYSIRKKDNVLLYKTAIVAFLASSYIPIMFLLNDKILIGLIIITLVLGLAGLAFYNLGKEKNWL